jgi:hypothetical protein
VSLVKLDNFPFVSTKSRKNLLLQKKITIFSIDKCSPFGLKINFFSSQASSHRLILIFRMNKKNQKKIRPVAFYCSYHCDLLLCCLIYAKSCPYISPDPATRRHRYNTDEMHDATKTKNFVFNDSWRVFRGCLA